MPTRFPVRLSAMLFAAAFSAASVSMGAELTNLALKKVATASAVEDGNPPENAVDGDESTRWCNSDAATGCWWEVDLGSPQKLGGGEILWEHDATVYRYVVEGSADNKTWKVLNDQRGSDLDTQSQKLLLAGDEARYVRIRITGLADGSWASFFEVKLYSADDMKKLSADELKPFKPPAPEKSAADTQNVALKKKVTASSTENGHDPEMAVDGNDLTRWCAADDQTPAWLMIDLADAPATESATARAPATADAPKPFDISEIDIKWEKAAAYQFIVEGSLDGKTWETLSDQKNNADQTQNAQLKFAAKPARFVRITATGMEPGVWMSIFEVKVLAAKK